MAKMPPGTSVRAHQAMTVVIGLRAAIRNRVAIDDRWRAAAMTPLRPSPFNPA
jgi:hypothetical protein